MTYNEPKSSLFGLDAWYIKESRTILDDFFDRIFSPFHVQIPVEIDDKKIKEP